MNDERSNEEYRKNNQNVVIDDDLIVQSKVSKVTEGVKNTKEQNETNDVSEKKKVSNESSDAFQTRVDDSVSIKYSTSSETLERNIFSLSDNFVTLQKRFKWHIGLAISCFVILVAELIGLMWLLKNNHMRISYVESLVDNVVVDGKNLQQQLAINENYIKSNHAVLEKINDLEKFSSKQEILQNKIFDQLKNFQLEFDKLKIAVMQQKFFACVKKYFKSGDKKQILSELDEIESEISDQNTPEAVMLKNLITLNRQKVIDNQLLYAQQLINKLDSIETSILALPRTFIVRHEISNRDRVSAVFKDYAMPVFLESKLEFLKESRVLKKDNQQNKNHNFLSKIMAKIPEKWISSCQKFFSKIVQIKKIDTVFTVDKDDFSMDYRKNMLQHQINLYFSRARLGIFLHNKVAINLEMENIMLLLNTFFDFKRTEVVVIMETLTDFVKSISETL